LKDGDWAVSIPGCDSICSGMLFADDLVILAESPEELQSSLFSVGAWAIDRNFDFSIKKCCIIVPGVKYASTEFSLLGETVPVVENYTYLGIQIDASLSIDTMVTHRLNKTKKTLGSLLQVITNKLVPISAKLLVIKGILIPVSSYGCELFASSVRKIQPVINQALRAVIGLNMKSIWAQNFHLWAELGVPPLEAVAAKARIRLFMKASSGELRTWIGVLANQVYRCRGVTWVSQCLRWLKKFSVVNLDEIIPLVWAMRKDEAFKVYERTAGWAERLTYPGMELVYQARLNALPLGEKLKHMDERFKNKCPFCLCVEVETLKHMFEDCSAWNDLRVKYLKDCPKGYIEILGGCQYEFRSEVQCREFVLGLQARIPNLVRFVKSVMWRRFGLLPPLNQGPG